jgi:dTDP-4-dehydrorhamnose 3,5-epimerase
VIIQKTKLDGVFLINPTKYVDNRGYFTETFNKQKINEFKNLDFIQDNQSLSVEKFVFRGLHYQIPPFAQDKLVRVLKGKILDIVLDIRKSSRTFGKYQAFEISSSEFNQIFIPKGFAHGFLTLEENTEAFYKVTNYYSSSHDLGINIKDSELGINLPINMNELILSEKDKSQPNFKQAKYYFD